MIVLVSLIVFLRRLLVPIAFLVHPYISIHSVECFTLVSLLRQASAYIRNR